MTAGSPARARAAAARRSASSRRASWAATASASGATTTVPASPSSRSGVPSATARMPGPRPATAGMPSARAMIAACEVGPPPAVAIPATRSGSSAAASAAPTSSGDEDRRRGLPVVRLGAGPRQPGEHPPPHVEEIGCSRAQVLVVESLVASGGRADGVVPRARRGGARGDRGLGRLDQRLVAEQQDLGVEDVGGLGPGPLGGRGAQVAQVGRDGLAGGGQRGPLLLGGPGRRVRERGALRADGPRRPGRLPGGRRDAAQHLAGGGRGRSVVGQGLGRRWRGGRGAILLGDQGRDGRRGPRRPGARGRGSGPCGRAAPRASRGRSGCGRPPGRARR